MDWDKFKTSVNTFNNGSWGQVAPAAISTAAPFVTKGNHSVLGDLGMGIGGAVALANPLIGAGIMAASVLGNAAFGANINEGAVQDYQNRLVDYSRPNITAQDNTQLMNQLGTLGSFNINKKDLGTQGWFSHKLDKKYDSLMSDLGAANASRASIVDSAVSNVDKMNDMRIAANYRAFGGPMFEYISDGAIAYDMARDNLMAKLWNAQNKKQAELSNSSFKDGGPMFTDFDLGLTFINAGGSHEKNPYGGVPLGVDPEGAQNVGEEGEVVFNNYVFSKRLPVPQAIRSKYKLREKTSFADAIKEYFKKNGVDERENDPIAMNGLMAFATDLAISQEMSRPKRKKNSFAGGGYITYDRSKNKDNYFNELYKEDSDYMKALNWYNDPAHTAERDTLIAAINAGKFDNDLEKINNYNVTPDNWYQLATDYKKGPVHNAILSLAGREFGPGKDMTLNQVEQNRVRPVGTAPTTVVPDDVLAGLGGEWTEEEIARVFPQQGPAVAPIPSLVERANAMNVAKANAPLFGGLIGPIKEEPTETSRGTAEGESSSPYARRRSNIAGLLAHTGALAYNLLDPYRPGTIDEIRDFNTISGTPVGQYAPIFHNDTRYNTNRLAQQAAATRAAIMDNIDPNRWSNLLVADYNAQTAQGEQLRADKMAEYEALLKSLGFNRDTDKFNSQIDLDVAKDNAARKQAYDNARMQQRQYNISNYDAYKRGKDAAIGQSITGIANWFDADRRERDALAMVDAVRNSGALQSNEVMDLLSDYFSGTRPTKKRKGGK